MQFSKYSILSLFLFTANISSFAMQKGPVTPILEQLFNHVKLAMQMSTTNQEERENYTNWSFIKIDDNRLYVKLLGESARDLDAKNTIPLIIKSRDDVPLDMEKPNQYLPRVMYYEKENPRIKYSVVGIQNHAIRCYKQSRSWFENHPFQFASLTAATGIGIGWFVKTWLQKPK